jgi:hypothetical protein
MNNLGVVGQGTVAVGGKNGDVVKKCSATIEWQKSKARENQALNPGSDLDISRC